MRSSKNNRNNNKHRNRNKNNSVDSCRLCCVLALRRFDHTRDACPFGSRPSASEFTLTASISRWAKHCYADPAKCRDVSLSSRDYFLTVATSCSCSCDIQSNISPTSVQHQSNTSYFSRNLLQRAGRSPETLFLKRKKTLLTLA